MNQIFLVLFLSIQSVLALEWLEKHHDIYLDKQCYFKSHLKYHYDQFSVNTINRINFTAEFPFILLPYDYMHQLRVIFASNIEFEYILEHNLSFIQAQFCESELKMFNLLLVRLKELSKGVFFLNNRKHKQKQSMGNLIDAMSVVFKMTTYICSSNFLSDQHVVYNNNNSDKLLDVYGAIFSQYYSCYGSPLNSRLPCVLNTTLLPYPYTTPAIQHLVATYLQQSLVPLYEQELGRVTHTYKHLDLDTTVVFNNTVPELGSYGRQTGSFQLVISQTVLSSNATPSTFRDVIVQMHFLNETQQPTLELISLLGAFSGLKMRCQQLQPDVAKHTLTATDCHAVREYIPMSYIRTLAAAAMSFSQLTVTTGPPMTQLTEPHPLAQHEQANCANRPYLLAFGLGGGTLHGFLLHHHACLVIETVEISVEVVQAAIDYMGMGDDICEVNVNETNIYTQLLQRQVAPATSISMNAQSSLLELGLELNNVSAVTPITCRSKVTVMDSAQFLDSKVESALTSANSRHQLYDFILFDIYNSNTSGVDEADRKDKDINPLSIATMHNLRNINSLLNPLTGLAIFYLHCDQNIDIFFSAIQSVFQSSRIVKLKHDGASTIYVASMLPLYKLVGLDDSRFGYHPCNDAAAFTVWMQMFSTVHEYNEQVRRSVDYALDCSLQ